MVTRRLQHELQDLSTSPPENCSVIPDAQDLFHWTARISGPRETPYESGRFDLDVSLPVEYPMKPPIVIFKTKIYHPNVSSKGIICLDTLKEKWVPIKKVRDILSDIASMLEHPNLENPLVPELAQQLKTDCDGFKETAREWTQKYAKS
jgi:ubiquitin-conjugating enzyme E2 D/E